MNWEEIWNKISKVLVDGGWILLKVVLLFIVGYLVIRLVKRILKKMLEKSLMDNLAKKFILRTVSFILYFALVLLLIQVVGIQISGLLAAIAAAGLAVALALQDSLASLANGVILIITKPFKENDVVEINGISGKVKAIQFFNTVIDTWDNKRIIIPNKNMINYQIKNINYHPSRRFSIYLTFNESIDFKKVKEIVLKTILANNQVYSDPAPQFLLQEITDKGIEVEARGWASSQDCDVICIDVRESIFNELKRNNIDLENNRLIVHVEERDKNQYFDNTPLPQRDDNLTPKQIYKEELSFEEMVDNMSIKKLIPKKMRNKKSNKIDKK